MKKILPAAISVLSLLVLSVVNIPYASAGGSSAKVTLQALSSSAPADGSSTITFKLYSYNHGCVPPAYATGTTTCNDGSAMTDYADGGYNIWVRVAGSGYTIGGATHYQAGDNVKTGSDGYATFTLSSTTVGSDTVSADGGDADSQPSVTVSFTTPVAATPAPTKNTTPTQTSTPATTPAPTPTPPAAPTTGLKLDDQTVAATTTPTVEAGKTVTLSGTTVPNATVTLYIFSTPRQATVTADAQGDWTYQIIGLEPGSHHVEATVTDPATKLTSNRVTLAKFTIAKPAATAITTKTAAKKTTPMSLWIAGALAVVCLSAGGVWWLLRKHRHGTTPPSAPTDAQPPMQMPSSADSSQDEQ